MNLIDDYLRAVAILLPKAQREDIAAELRELILSRIEAREAELARPLTADETEGVLREIGHPIVVAARYREGPQSIVGPALYPFWVFAVKAALTVQMCIVTIVFIVQAFGAGDVGRAIGHAFANGITGAATLIGFITAAGWIIERQAVKPDYLQNWRVKDLKILEIAAWNFSEWRTYMGMNDAGLHAAQAGRAGAAGATAGFASDQWTGRRDPDRAWRRLRRRERHQASRGLGVIVWASVFLLWWTGLLHFGFSASEGAWRSVGVDPGGLAGVDWAALKAEVFWPVVGYTLLGAAWGFVVMARPFAHRTQGVLDIVQGALMIGFVWWLATLSPLATAVGADTPASLVLKVRDGFEGGPPFPLTAVVIVILACMVFNGLARVLRGLWLMVDPHPLPLEARRGG